MQSLKLHIVGFPYRKNIEGHVSEFLSDAPGHGMTLRPQRNNEVDVHAIRAYDWEGRHVGFVSGIAFVEMKKAIDLTKQAKEREEADRQHVNVIMTGQNASYIENHQ